MNILFIHQNFPGQFVHLAADLAKDKQHRVMALSIYKQRIPDGVTLRLYTMLRSAIPETHPLLRDQEAKVLRAEACAAAVMQLRREGFVPDLIVAHPGWGEALFMKEVCPKAKLILYCEYYYSQEGQDVGFDPEMVELTLSQRYQLRLKNTINILSMEIADAAISPTQWQKNTYPAWAQEKISVIHDGVDSTQLTHRPRAKLQLPNTLHCPELSFKCGDEVLTYVARNLEPVRGFQVLMRMLPNVLRRRPNAQILIVGGDGVSYGGTPPSGGSWREHMWNEVGNEIDPRRIHFLGQVPYNTYLDLLSISKVHVYWTTPFVLSWSFLEAACAGVPMVASATPPVKEFASELGVQLVDFYDVERFSDAVVKLLVAEARPKVPRMLPRIELTRCIAQQKILLFSHVT